MLTNVVNQSVIQPKNYGKTLIIHKSQICKFNNIMLSYTYLFKFILIGDQSVGKSCILMQFIDNQFRVDSDPTIGVEFGSKNISLDKKTIKLQIWDTAGQEAYKSITRSYYRSTIGAVLVYDITSKRSFQSLQKWLEETHRHSNNQHIVVMLVGNKNDLQNRQVTTQQGEQFANKNGLLFCECSAKTGSNIQNIFMTLSNTIVQRIQGGKINPADESGGIKMGRLESYPKTTSKKCC